MQFLRSFSLSAVVGCTVMLITKSEAQARALVLAEPMTFAKILPYLTLPNLLLLLGMIGSIVAWIVAVASKLANSFPNNETLHWLAQNGPAVRGSIAKLETTIEEVAAVPRPELPKLPPVAIILFVLCLPALARAQTAPLDVSRLAASQLDVSRLAADTMTYNAAVEAQKPAATLAILAGQVNADAQQLALDTGKAVAPVEQWSPATWKPTPWNGPLALASWDLVKGRFVPGVAISVGWSGFLSLPDPHFSFVFGGAAGHETSTATWMLRPYIGVGYGGNAKMEPSFQVGFCPPLLVIQDGFVQTPRIAFCTGGALPIF